MPDDVIIEHAGDLWNDAFRPDFIFSPDNINRLDEFDRHDHDDAGAGRFGGGRNVNPYRAPSSGQNDRKRSAAGHSGSSMQPPRKYRY